MASKLNGRSARQPSPDHRLRSVPADRSEVPDSRGVAASSPAGVRDGFTLLEVLFVLMIVVVTMAVASHTYASYLERTTSERAAKIFSRDLSLARTGAIQGREKVVVRLTSSERRYVVESESGRRMAERRYDDDAETVLSEMGLDLPGDSVVFDARGIADLSGVDGAVGTATFRAGNSTHVVSFNAMGASRVESP